MHAPRSWQGRSLRQLDLRRSSTINVLLIKTQNARGPLVSPTADYVFQPDDVVVVMGLDGDVTEISDAE